MFRLWRWAFARLYVRNQRVDGDAALPGVVSAAMVSALITLNLLTVVWALSCVIVSATSIALSKVNWLATWCVIAIVAYRSYVTKGRADRLIRKLQRESRSRTRRGERRLWIYLAASVVPWCAAHDPV